MVCVPQCVCASTKQDHLFGLTQQLNRSPNLVRSDSEVMPEDKFLIQSLPLTPSEAQDKLSSTSVCTDISILYLIFLTHPQYVYLFSGVCWTDGE